MHFLRAAFFAKPETGSEHLQAMRAQPNPFSQLVSVAWYLLILGAEGAKDS